MILGVTETEGDKVGVIDNVGVIDGVAAAVTEGVGVMEGVKEGVADAGTANSLLPNTNPGSIRPSCAIF